MLRTLTYNLIVCVYHLEQYHFHAFFDFGLFICLSYLLFFLRLLLYPGICGRDTSSGIWALAVLTFRFIFSL